MIFGYIRVSTEEQTKTGRSGIQRQKEFIFEKAKSLGYQPPDVTIIDDSGVSGFGKKERTNIKGGNLGKFLDEVVKGQHDGSTFLVENIDRLARDFAEGMGAILKLKKHNVTILTKDGGFENLSDQLFATLSLIRAQEESDAKKDKIIGSYDSRIADAKLGIQRQFNQVPNFYVWDGTKYITDPDYEKTILRSVELYLKGQGYGMIAKTLNDENRKGSKDPIFWKGSHVSALLSHKSLMGDFYIKNQVLSEYFPPTLSQDTYAKLKVALSQRKAFGRGGQPFNDTLITALGGITRCGRCQGALVKTRTRYNTYSIRCQRCITEADGKTIFGSALLAPIEHAVFSWSIFFIKEDEKFEEEDKIKFCELEVARLGKVIESAFLLAEGNDDLLTIAKERARKAIQEKKTYESELEKLNLKKLAMNTMTPIVTEWHNIHKLATKGVLLNEPITNTSIPGTFRLEDHSQEEIAHYRSLVSRTYEKIEIFFNGIHDQSKIEVRLTYINKDKVDTLTIDRKTKNYLGLAPLDSVASISLLPCQKPVYHPPKFKITLKSSQKNDSQTIKSNQKLDKTAYSSVPKSTMLLILLTVLKRVKNKLEAND